MVGLGVLTLLVIFMLFNTKNLNTSTEPGANVSRTSLAGRRLCNTARGLAATDVLSGLPLWGNGGSAGRQGRSRPGARVVGGEQQSSTPGVRFEEMLVGEEQQSPTPGVRAEEGSVGEEQRSPTPGVRVEEGFVGEERRSSTPGVRAEEIGRAHV